uniref:Uncharacterized protein n=1 Tax=Anopheles quadriannulatus TaxID=34691 RepID=A0A182XST4_ANOQN
MKIIVVLLSFIAMAFAASIPWRSYYFYRPVRVIPTRDQDAPSETDIQDILKWVVGLNQIEPFLRDVDAEPRKPPRCNPSDRDCNDYDNPFEIEF